jgi:hypothetical protein
MSKRGFAAIVTALAFGLVHPAGAAIIKANPIEDQSANDANRDGVWDTLNPANENALLVYNGGQTYDFRVAMEFDVRSVPRYAHVDLATLFLKYDGANGHQAKAMRVNGYAGDGQLTLADFNVPTNPVAPLQDSFAPPGGYWLINVTPFVQSLVDQRQSYAGFMLENLEVIQTAVLPREDPNPANRPLLSVSFTPIPLPAGLVPGALLGVGITANLARRRYRRSHC